MFCELRPSDVLNDRLLYNRVMQVASKLVDVSTLYNIIVATYTNIHVFQAVYILYCLKYTNSVLHCLQASSASSGTPN